MVSIIIPTFNRCGPLFRAIDSVLRQSFKDFELIVVDDGSVDDTTDFIKGYHDPRLRYIKKDHSGVAKTRNFGALAAKYDWLCFLDSDDLWFRHKLSEQVQFHYRNPDFVISQTDDMWIRNSVRVNKNAKHNVREGDLFLPSLKLCLICASSVMIRKDKFFESGGFDEDLLVCEDYSLWLRITVKYPVGFVHKILVTKFGGHEDQLSKSFPVMDSYRVRALEKFLKSSDLSEEKKCAVREEISRRQSIIDCGKLKRIK